MKTLVAILGPTASGKTSVCARLAHTFKSEVISCDSRQFFKELKIGTARPEKEEMLGVPHHFLGHISIEETYTAGQFEQEAIAKIREIHTGNDLCFMVGGSGLYARAVVEGIDDIPSDETIRNEWIRVFETEGIKPLQEKLQVLDPDYFNNVDKNNHVRLIRAIEVCLSGQKPYSAYRTNRVKTRPFETIKIALDVDREILYGRINFRVDQMIGMGLLEEVKKVAHLRHLNALQTVGYQEIFDYLDNRCDLEKAVEKIKQNTRNYAKRQLTWLRKETDVAWFDPTDLSGMTGYIQQKTTENG